METILKNQENPHWILFKHQAEMLRAAGFPVLRIDTAIKNNTQMLALVTYYSGAEQRIPINNLSPADTMFKVLQIVKETYYSKI